MFFLVTYTLKGFIKNNAIKSMMLEFQPCEHEHYQIWRKPDGSLGKVS